MNIKKNILYTIPFALLSIPLSISLHLNYPTQPLVAVHKTSFNTAFTEDNFLNKIFNILEANKKNLATTELD
ncbi:hypothetical protein NV226_01860 [Mycoplasma iguanae]|uniref:Uncharacterized protein n=1 Tax=Mycoplasma iguanae TaxID=292461 RepID=A0ABY5RB67_9MOLU|nr:hypothetical protein [Mycoplasma iguanae]UVD81460.1 hypothetical protein NV226_01860 [Mycoplasma iguanae]